MSSFKEIQRQLAEAKAKAEAKKVKTAGNVYCRCCNYAFNIVEETALSYIDETRQYHAKVNCDLMRPDES